MRQQEHEQLQDVVGGHQEQLQAGIAAVEALLVQQEHEQEDVIDDQEEDDDLDTADTPANDQQDQIVGMLARNG